MGNPGLNSPTNMQMTTNAQMGLLDSLMIAAPTNDFLERLDRTLDWQPIPNIRPQTLSFKPMVIKPQTGTLASTKMTVPTIQGSVRVNIVGNTASDFSMSVMIPANTSECGIADTEQHQHDCLCGRGDESGGQSAKYDLDQQCFAGPVLV
jgi:Bacterial alpha-L-rhamnosidase C-terminal domain